MKYKVNVSMELYASKVFEVEASSKKEAETRAMDMATTSDFKSQEVDFKAMWTWENK